jgi:hypothetical protein
LTGQLARFAGTAAVQQLIVERLEDDNAPREVRRMALEAIARSGLKETPTAWIAAVTKSLGGNDPELMPVAVATARALPVPKKLRNAVTKLMKEEGYGQDYKYAHDFDDGVVPGETYLPDDLADASFYEPLPRGEEVRIKARLEELRKSRQ